MRNGSLFWIALAAPLIALGAPSTEPTTSSSEHPVPTGTLPHPATYGLCSGPQNAADFPSSPVAVVETQCDYTQEFHATSPNAGYGGGTCGGYAVAFGPKGDLKRNWRYLWLTAGWGDAPLTQANCATAHLAAAAWGYRCTNAACSAGAWERIGAARSVHGTWNTTSQVCYLGIGANTGQKDYQTVTMDVIATQGQGRSALKKRASVAIHNMRPNGQCPSASYPKN